MIAHPANIFGENGLPVDLVHFKATDKDDKVFLDWRTATELNNEGFEVEKSQNGRTWESIGFVNGKGSTELTNDYSFIAEGSKLTAELSGFLKATGRDPRRYDK